MRAVVSRAKDFREKVERLPARDPAFDPADILDRLSPLGDLAKTFSGAGRYSVPGSLSTPD